MKIDRRQLYFFIMSLIVAAAGAYYFRGNKLIYFWITGICLGIVLHRSRFCMAAAVRDLVMFGDKKMTEALILLLVLNSAGFAFLQYTAAPGSPVPGFIFPVTGGTITGGFLFGLGSVLAGGCLCSLLTRLGEGFQVAFWAVAGVIAGATVGAAHSDWWRTGTKIIASVHLPTLLGWPAALGLQLTVLGFIYLFSCHRDKFFCASRKKGGRVKNG